MLETIMCRMAVVAATLETANMESLEYARACDEYIRLENELQLAVMLRDEMAEVN